MIMGKCQPLIQAKLCKAIREQFHCTQLGCFKLSLNPTQPWQQNKQQLKRTPKLCPTVEQAECLQSTKVKITKRKGKKMLNVTKCQLTNLSTPERVVSTSEPDRRLETTTKGILQIYSRIKNQLRSKLGVDYQSIGHYLKSKRALMLKLGN